MAFAWCSRPNWGFVVLAQEDAVEEVKAAMMKRAKQSGDPAAFAPKLADFNPDSSNEVRLCGA
jgi:hypothetical protein